jgi:H3 lysine-79-specific histone-lysine N-methyltransferase
MPLFGGKNKFKADPPKIRIEKVPVAPVKTNSKPSGPHQQSRLNGASRASPLSSRPSPNSLLRQKSHSPLPSSADEGRVDRKRKAGGGRVNGSSTPRRSPPKARVEFDKDSDAEDDGWMDLDARKRQRKSAADGTLVDPDRKLKSSRAFRGKVEGLQLIDAVEVASLETKCVPVMGAQKEDVAIEIQYPSLQRREKYVLTRIQSHPATVWCSLLLTKPSLIYRFELVWGKDKIDAVDASIRIVRMVAETYLTDDEAEIFTNPNNGLIRRLEKASNRNIQDLMGFKTALHEYNEALLTLVEDGVIAKNLDNLHELPRHLVAFILDQIYDRTVAPKVELLSKYENGTDYVYGELLHPFISDLLVEQTKMTSGQVFVDLGSGVGNVVCQAGDAR